jgi:subtilisin family serine protease
MMKKILLPFAARFGLILTLVFAVRMARADGIVPGYILLRIEEWQSIENVLAALGIDDDDDDDDGDGILEQIPNTRIYAIDKPRFETEQQLAERARQIPGVRYAETDSYVGDPKSAPIDEQPPPEALRTNHISNLIPQKATLQQIMNAGLAPAAYANQPAYTQARLNSSHTLATGEGIKIAILDTGVNPEHATVYGRCPQGFNAINQDLPTLDVPDGILNEVVGHGTMIAGLIARLAPNATLVPVRVLNGDGIGTGLSAAKGVMFAKEEGARVINISFSGGVFHEAMNEVIQLALEDGCTIVASAGNDGEGRTRYPAGMTGVISVASVQANGARSLFSNYGRTIDICAPGNAIVGASETGGYATWSGTSFAAPFVAAQAALLIERDSTLTPAQVITKIRQTAHSVSAYNPALRGLLGSGQISIEASLLTIPRR